MALRQSACLPTGRIDTTAASLAASTGLRCRWRPGPGMQSRSFCSWRPTGAREAGSRDLQRYRAAQRTPGGNGFVVPPSCVVPPEVTGDPAAEARTAAIWGLEAPPRFRRSTRAGRNPAPRSRRQSDRREPERLRRYPSSRVEFCPSMPRHGSMVAAHEPRDASCVADPLVISTHPPRPGHLVRRCLSHPPPVPPRR